MKLRALKSGAFLVVLLGVEAVHATDAGMAAGDKAVTLSAVTLDIVQNGRKAGSTKVPPGRSVDIVEVQEGRAKVAAAPFLSGWVAFSDLKTVAAGPVPAAKDQVEIAGDAPPPAGLRPETQTQSTRKQASRIDIKETRTSNEIVGEGESKCRGIEHSVSFVPTLTRGSDLEGKEAVLRFYLIVMQEDEEKTKSSKAERRIVVNGDSFKTRKTFYKPAVRRLKDVALPLENVAVKTIDHDYTEWQCNCCRDLRHGEFVGWYAELLDGDKVVSKTQSSLDAKASEALESSLAQGAL
jgi:hypothetical protein